MRALTVEQQAVFDTRQVGARWRVLVKSSGGPWRDLTTWPGFNACVSASVSTDIDADVWSASIQLKRAVEEASLAGLMADSPLNLGFAYPGTYAALIEPGREVKIDVAYVGVDQEPAAADWVNIFHGEIDSPDDGNDPITLEARDLGGRLQDKFIEVERVYGAGPTTGGARIWKAGETYALNEFIVPADPNGHWYKVTTAGTAALTTPVWNTGPGSTTTSGTAVFTQQGTTPVSTAAETLMQAVLNDNPVTGGAVALYTPVSPAWNVKSWLNTREPVLKPQKMLAEQRGWNARYKYDTGTSSWRFTLYGPDRTKTVPDQTFAPGRVRKVTQAKRDRTRVRNKVRVIFRDSADTWPNGDAKVKSYEAVDSASQTKYGVRFMEVAEEDTSHIDTTAEAQTFADAMLADLKDPQLGLGVELSIYPFADLGDLYRFEADEKRFSSNQDLAVVGITHTLKGGKEQSCRTQLVCSGKPAAGSKRPLRKEARPGVRPNHDLQLWNGAAKSTAITEAIAGGHIRVTASFDKRTKWEGLEVYLSETSGFTPSSSTLKYRGRANGVTIADLKPGVTYYEKHVPYGFNSSRLVRGEISAESSFVAGYVRPKHLHPSMTEVAMPLNGSFELYDATDRPECWEDDFGAFGTAWTLDRTISFDGAAAVKFEVSTLATAIRSLLFPVRPSLSYTMTTAFRPQPTFPGVRTAALMIRWYTSAGALISTSSTNVALGSLTAGVFTEQSTAFTSPATAAFARALVVKESLNADFYFHADAVKVYQTPAAGGGGSLTGSGANTQIAFWTTASNLSGDVNLVWDSALDRLGVGVAAPSYHLHVKSAGNATGGFESSSVSGQATFVFRDNVGSEVSALGHANASFPDARAGSSYWLSSGVDLTIWTNGVNERARFYNATGNARFDGADNTLYIDAVNNRVYVGAAASAATLGTAPLQVTGQVLATGAGAAMWMHGSGTPELYIDNTTDTAGSFRAIGSGQMRLGSKGSGGTKYLTLADGDAVDRVWVKEGNVGIGTTVVAADSKLKVAGVVESTAGGVKFPDATTQVTAARFVEVTVDFGATPSTLASTVVTGLAWMTATAKIIASPAMTGNADRADGVEDILLEQVRAAGHTRVAGTGFTLTAHAPEGTTGLHTFHCCIGG